MEAIRQMKETSRLIFILYLKMGALFFTHIKKRRSEILEQLAVLGWGSLPVVVVSTASAGMVVCQEMAYHMDLVLKTVEMVPGFSTQFIVRELGVAIPAFLLTAKVGASITAEVGTMKVTEQLDALKLLSVNPVEFLTFPRFIASILITTILTVFSIAITFLTGLLAAVQGYSFNTLQYITASTKAIDEIDLLSALVKGAVFGSVIPIVSCVYGFRCKEGAEGVGRATTDSVVTSTILIILLDLILTAVFASLFR